MNQYPAEEHDGPLDELLSGVPDEAAPPDLEARCLKAVRSAREEASRAPRSTWFRAVQGLAAAAAVFLLVVSVASLHGLPFGLAKRAAPAGMSARTAATEGPGSAEIRDPNKTSVGAAAPAAPALSKGITDWSTDAGDEVAQRSPGGAAGPPDARYKSYSGSASTLSNYPADNAVTTMRPWRDQSGDKQKIISRTMEVEVPEVEEAYRQATSLIEKADGTVVSEELRVDEGGRNRAHLFARIPVDRFDGVVAQIKDLGKIVTLVGESEDRTKEYNAKGSDIRDVGASEVELVDRYEKETNSDRKRQLYTQIQALRAENKDRKSGLKQLSEQTHYATLDLTLLEGKGPSQFLAQVLENSKTAGSWVAATAVVWVPLLVIVWLGTALARRRREQS